MLGNGPLMIGMEGISLSPLDKINKQAAELINGYILYGKNYATPAQLLTLTTDIQQSRARLGLAPALIAVDHEGGTVQRLVDDYFTAIPHAKAIGDLYLQDKDTAKALLQDIALVSSAELGSCGITLCLNPCLDLNTNYSTKVTYRSFSAHEDKVIELSSILLNSFKAQGMQVMGKHYPGFGAAIFDTHSHFPIIDITWETLESTHLKPFSALIKQQLLPSIMLTHGAYIRINTRPVPVSPFWLQSVLREQLAFEGVIMTDCLAMVAAKPLGSNYSSRVTNCLRAGCDIVLLSYSVNSLHNIIKNLSQSEELAAYQTSEQGQKSNERINNLRATKPVEYFQDLRETQAYHVAKKHVAFWAKEQAKQFILGVSSHKKEQNIPAWLLLIKKYFKPLIKRLSKNPWIWEKLSSVYLRIIKIQRPQKRA